MFGAKAPVTACKNRRRKRERERKKSEKKAFFIDEQGKLYLLPLVQNNSLRLC
jgi:hypothetical protein